MKLYSTNNKNNVVDLKEAVLQAFPADKGLYLPTEIPTLDQTFLDNLHNLSFKEICLHISSVLLNESLSQKDIKEIVERAINFPAPLVHIAENVYSLELFHGPTMAFKDFGARFMANLMAKLLAGSNEKTTILVATSGDTGGAVASGFFGVDNIDVIILYPSGKVSPLQEKQLTSWGGNIKAVEVDGVFDDCQRLVKQAFLDKDLCKKYSFSSANSINIARLIPQSFYYFEAFKQLPQNGHDTYFSVPSGNFGNLTAGILAKKMGLGIKGFIAAVNANTTFYDYINSGVYQARPTISTMSNAMDVGDPSNFVRLKALMGSTWNTIKNEISCFSYTDDQTKEAIKSLFKDHNYMADPHGALAYLACIDHQQQKLQTKNYVFLETAHPYKFVESVQPLLNKTMPIPRALSQFMNKTKSSLATGRTFEAFKNLLLSL